MLPPAATHDRCTASTRQSRHASGKIIQLLAEGKTNKETAPALGVAVKTVEAHRANIVRKLRLRSVSDLVRYAIRNKIVQA